MQLSFEQCNNVWLPSNIVTISAYWSYTFWDLGLYESKVPALLCSAWRRGQWKGGPCASQALPPPSVRTPRLCGIGRPGRPGPGARRGRREAPGSSASTRGGGRSAGRTAAGPGHRWKRFWRLWDCQCNFEFFCMRLKKIVFWIFWKFLARFKTILMVVAYTLFANF